MASFYSSRVASVSPTSPPPSVAPPPPPVSPLPPPVSPLFLSLPSPTHTPSLSRALSQRVGFSHLSLSFFSHTPPSLSLSPALRKGLRIHDNPALDHARRGGCARLFPVFVLDPRSRDRRGSRGGTGSGSARTLRTRVRRRSGGPLRPSAPPSLPLSFSLPSLPGEVPRAALPRFLRRFLAVPRRRWSGRLGGVALSPAETRWLPSSSGECRDLRPRRLLCGSLAGARRRWSRSRGGGEEGLMSDFAFLTSGLDSTTAARIVGALRRMAADGRRTVVVTIHQPSSRLYHMFDKVLLLSAEGCPIYYGRSADALPYFASVGFASRLSVNPADLMLDLANGWCFTKFGASGVVSRGTEALDRLRVGE